MNPRNFAILLLSLLLNPCLTCALPADRQQPVEIEADRMTLDEPTNTSTYTGNVKLIQGSIQIDAQSLTVITENGRVRLMRITGTTAQPAHFRQQTKTGELVEGTAEHIEYNANEAQLVLLGNAELKQGGNHVRSQRIEYNTETNSLNAGTRTNGENTPGERVKMIIKPQNNQNP